MGLAGSNARLVEQNQAPNPMNSDNPTLCWLHSSQHNPSWRPALPKSLTTGGGGIGGGGVHVYVWVYSCLHPHTVLRHHTPSWRGGVDEKVSSQRCPLNGSKSLCSNHKRAKHSEDDPDWSCEIQWYLPAHNFSCQVVTWLKCVSSNKVRMQVSYVFGFFGL